MKNWLILSLIAIHSVVFTLDVEAGLFKKRRQSKSKCVSTCPAPPACASYAVPYKKMYSSSNQYFCTLSQSWSTSEGGPMAGTKTGNGMGDSGPLALQAAVDDLKAQCQAPYCYLIGTPVCDSCVDYYGANCCPSMEPAPVPVPAPAAAPMAAVPMAGTACCRLAPTKFYICRIRVCFCDGESTVIPRGATCPCVAYRRAYEAARAAACHHGGIRWSVRCGCMTIIEP